MWLSYFIPETLDEALELLARHAPQARVIAGGTDLLVEFDRGARAPCALIDISRLPNLNAIWQDDEGYIHLGALVTHNDVVAAPLCVNHALPLAQACRQVGAPQIRNRGTLAGNLITASPANDTITPLLALDAEVTLRSTRGERRVPLAEFYLGVRRTVMQPDELLTEIRFQGLSSSARGCFLKLGLRQAQAISVVNACAIIWRDAQGRVEQARIALGAVAPTIIRAREAEAALVGHTLTDEAIEQCARLAAQAAAPIDDLRGSAAYRRDMVGVLTRRALRQVRDTSTTDWQPAALLWTDAPASRSPRWQDDQPLRVRVNGRSFVIDSPEAKHKTLLRLLREDCGMVGVKEGCSEGECGACTVILDGRAVMACLVPAPRAHEAEVITIEGVAALGNGDTMHPLQRAFIEHGAVQCGYCTPGFIMSGAALLREHAHPSDAQIHESISGNLCRCTGYYKIVEAFRAASERLHPTPTDPQSP